MILILSGDPLEYKMPKVEQKACLNVSFDTKVKVIHINETRPQDKNIGETVAYIVEQFEKTQVI